MARKDLRNVTMKIIDKTAVTPLELVVKIGTGNITWSENFAYEYEPDRGTLAPATGTVRKGDDTPVEVSVQCTWEFIIGDGAIQPYEALTGTGLGASIPWVSTASDACEPYAVTLQFFHDVGCGATKDETIKFVEFRVEKCDFDFQAGTLSFSGKSKEVRPTVTRNVAA